MQPFQSKALASWAKKSILQTLNSSSWLVYFLHPKFFPWLKRFHPTYIFPTFLHKSILLTRTWPRCLQQGPSHCQASQCPGTQQGAIYFPSHAPHIAHWHSSWLPNILTFFLVYSGILAVFKNSDTLSAILTLFLASILEFKNLFRHSFWHSIWHVFWHSI